MRYFSLQSPIRDPSLVTVRTLEKVCGIRDQTKGIPFLCFPSTRTNSTAFLARAMQRMGWQKLPKKSGQHRDSSSQRDYHDPGHTVVRDFLTCGPSYSSLNFSNPGTDNPPHSHIDSPPGTVPTLISHFLRPATIPPPPSIHPPFHIDPTHPCRKKVQLLQWTSVPGLA